MRNVVPNLLGILILLFILSPCPAQAGFFDNVINEVKQAAEKAVSDTIDETTDSNSGDQVQSTGQTATTEYPAPAYDATLVRQIQQQLNRLGYPAGTPDGLYGPGTRKAIEAFQKDQDLVIDGQPSTDLLAKLNAAHPATTANKPQTAGADTPPEPTLAALMLAAVHYKPDLLDDELTLQRALLTVHPELQSEVSNEFKWRKRKDELKNQLLQEAKDAQLNFELQPWRNSYTKTKPVELVKYDFDRQAFLVRLITKSLTSGEPAAKYPQTIDWLRIPPDQAEQIDSYFSGKKRQVYLHYRLKAVGTLIDASRPTPVMEFVDDQLELYARESTPQGNKMHTEHKLLARVKVPLTDNPTQMPVDSEAVEPQSAKPTAVIQQTEIDGVKLGMPIEKALAALQAHGYEMQQPSPPSPLTGITIKGKGGVGDGAGWIEVMIRHMNGVVYQYHKAVTYRKFPAGITAADLHKQYQGQFVDRFSKARYRYTAANKKIHFDDQAPPPYGGKILTPHVQSYLSDAQQVSSFVATIDLTWKQPVGADW